MDRSALANWEAAGKAWRPRPPLTPGAQDIEWYERAARETRVAGSLRALQLGVTPGIAVMAWPQTSSIVAVDWAAAMIRHVWPRAGLPPGAAVVRANWFAMPLADNSRDFVISDGCFTVIGGIQAARDLNREVSRVLKPAGTFAIRMFCRGDEPPAVEQVFDDLLNGRQTDLGLFRFLLAMAVQGDDPTGVSTSDVGRLWKERVANPARAARQFDWLDSDIISLERWRTQQVRYVFFTLAEFRALVAPYFDVVSCDIPDYPCGQHFLRLTLVNKK